MTDHIIKAKRQPRKPSPDALARVYDLAFAAGMERAAEICTNEGLYCTAHNIRAAAAIGAHKEGA